MKKLAGIILISMLALTACGSSDEMVIGGDGTGGTVTSETQQTADSAEDTDAADSAGGYVFNYNGTEIAIDSKMDTLLEALGQEDSYFEAPSCAFDGIQKVYTYGSMELDTYIGEDGDYLDAIILKDDLIGTPEGVRVGDTPEKVREVYGDGYTDNNGSYTYEKDNMKLNFIIEDGAVVSIQYKSNAVG